MSGVGSGHFVCPDCTASSGNNAMPNNDPCDICGGRPSGWHVVTDDVKQNGWPLHVSGDEIRRVCPRCVAVYVEEHSRR